MFSAGFLIGDYSYLSIFLYDEFLYADLVSFLPFFSWSDQWWWWCRGGGGGRGGGEGGGQKSVCRY